MDSVQPAESVQPADAMLRLPGIVKVRGAGPGRPGGKAGGVHCLLSQNGAGKSKLIKVLSGAHRPDAGGRNKQREVVLV